MAQTYHDLEAVVEQPDDQFKTTLPSVIDDVEENVATVLVEQPASYEALSTRMSTLEGVGEYAAGHTETIETFLDVLWTGMELISEHVPAVSERIDQEYTANWIPEDAPVAWHMASDPDAGTVTGGSGRLDDAEIVFTGSADVMFSMLGDDEFNPTMAFMQNRFDIEGPLMKARGLGSMMETVTEHARQLDSEHIEE